MMLDAFPKTDLILKRALELHPDLDLNLSNHGDRVRRFTSGGIAQTLSEKKKGETEHDSLLLRRWKSPVRQTPTWLQAPKLWSPFSGEQEHPDRGKLVCQ